MAKAKREKPLVAIVNGLLNPIPTVKAGGPQLVIWNTCKHLSSDAFDWLVLSKWDDALTDVPYNPKKFHQVRIGGRELRMSRLAQKLPYRLVKAWFGVVRPDHLALNLAMVRELKSLQPDVVIVHESYSLCFMIARALPKAKIVYYHHSSRLDLDLDEKNWKRLVKSANSGIISINQKVFGSVKQKFGRMPKETWVILNAVDDILRENSSIKPKKDENFRFIYVGRLNSAKGLEKLIEAFGTIYTNRTLSGLMIVGAVSADEDGEKAFEQRLKKIASLISKSAIEFSGFVPNNELATLYSESDCAVLVSELPEGNSLFLMEGLVMGLPVIATSMGGVPEVVRDGVDGILLEEGVSVEKLAEAMISMIDNRGKWDAGRDERMASARERFDYRRVAGQLEDVILEVING